MENPIAQADGTGQKPLLDVRDVNVTYLGRKKRVHAVRDCSFTIMPGESIGIVGESGSGKSTMAMALLRLQDPKHTAVSGQALFDGKDLLSLAEAQMNELRWTQIAVVFQRAMNALSPVHRISTQVEDIYRVHEPKATKAEVRERMTELLRLVNLPERVYGLYPHEMSGGMLQRVAIPGCMFAPRCPYADDRCRSHRPATATLPDGRAVRCWRYEGGCDHDDNA